MALNAERVAEEKRGFVRWLRPEYQCARAGVAPEQGAERGEQLEAPLVIAAAMARKPSFPASDLERTAAVFAALTEAARPLDAQSIAAKFRQGRKIEPSVARFWPPLRAWGNSTPAMASVSCNAVAGEAA